MIQILNGDLDITSITQADEPTTLKTRPVNVDSVLGRDYGTLKHANPAEPPLSLLVLHCLLYRYDKVPSALHALINKEPDPESYQVLWRTDSKQSRHEYHLAFTLIWKDGPKT